MNGGARPGAGRPKGSMNEETKIRMAVQKEFVHLAKNRAKKIIDKLIQRAEEGDVKAMKEFFDRLWGKAPMFIDLTTGGESLTTAYELSDEQLTRILRVRSGLRAIEATSTRVLDNDESEVRSELASPSDLREAGAGGEGGDQTPDDLHAAETREEPVSVNQLPGVVSREASG